MPFTQLINYHGEKWQPLSNHILEKHLDYLFQYEGLSAELDLHQLKKQLCYNLQYVEFLNKIIDDLETTSAVQAQNIKSLVGHGISVLEGIFYFLAQAKGKNHSTDQLLEIIRTNKWLGNDFEGYANLKKIEQIKSKMEKSDRPGTDANDWLEFTTQERELINQTLFDILTGQYFSKSIFLAQFDFLSVATIDDDDLPF